MPLSLFISEGNHNQKNTFVREILGVPCWTENIRRYKQDWKSHLLRMQRTRLPNPVEIPMLKYCISLWRPLIIIETVHCGYHLILKWLITSTLGSNGDWHWTVAKDAIELWIYFLWDTSFVNIQLDFMLEVTLVS